MHIQLHLIKRYCFKWARLVMYIGVNSYTFWKDEKSILLLTAKGVYLSQVEDIIKQLLNNGDNVYKRISYGAKECFKEIITYFACKSSVKYFSQNKKI